MKRILVAALLLASPAFSQSAMTAAEFEAYVSGKTLFFAAEGSRYGVEEYLPDRRVRWSFLDGKCKEGLWYEEAGQICFIYEDNPSPQCWTFFERNTGLSARFENEPDGTVLYEIEDTGEDMLCLGPEVGV
ncbi:hypothetical protein [Shimia sp. Alg240-R146]|uniref:hypothetical protein n=1 Tax=Shimia sp. Alg240-R146 TaxID=2993449 RepID=UPI0022E988BC|nr:hypothetical protein [Shimia sp. Alg240-R146]